MKDFVRDFDALDNLMAFTAESTDMPLIQMLEKVERLYEHFIDISSASHQAKNFSIAIFGSARLQPNTPEFQFICDLSQAIVETLGTDIVTGGGPGIMEAANKGLMHAVREQRDNFKKGNIPRSYGIRVLLPFEKEDNPYLQVIKHYKHFTTRLQSFVNLTQGAYVSAGGIGTLLELSLPWQLKQVSHLPVDFPLIVSPVWKPILETFYDMTFSQRENSIPLINPDNMALIQFSDDIEEIVEIFSIAHKKWQETQKSAG
jgi:predicted Rossmann-fold nucleotide-binding protein